MKNYSKVYVGKGKSVNSFATRFTVSVEEVLKYKYEKDGKEYFSFETAKMKEVDKFGKTHTMYVTVLVESETEPSQANESTPPPAPKKGRKRQTA